MKVKFLVGEYSIKANRFNYLIDLKSRHEWISIPERATRFDTEEEAFKFIKNNLNIFEDYIIRPVTIKKNKELKLGELIKVPHEIGMKASEVTIDVIKSVLKPDKRIFVSKMDKEYILNNRFEIKHKIIKQIGQLIDFHDTLDLFYVAHLRTHAIRDQKIKDGTNDWCLGCKVCSEIQRLRREMEHPLMRRNYNAIYDSRFPRFETPSGVGINKESNKNLAMLMHDYIDLRKEGKSLEAVAIAYSMSKSEFSKIVKRLRDDEKYCYVLGE